MMMMLQFAKMKPAFRLFVALPRCVVFFVLCVLRHFFMLYCISFLSHNILFHSHFVPLLHAPPPQFSLRFDPVTHLTVSNQGIVPSVEQNVLTTCLFHHEIKMNNIIDHLFM